MLLHAGRNCMRNRHEHIVPNRESNRPARCHRTGGSISKIKTVSRAMACNECRRKKKKCNMALPKCGLCSRSRWAVDCTYGRVPSSASNLGATSKPIRRPPSSLSLCSPDSAAALTPNSGSEESYLDISNFKYPLSFDIPTVDREKAATRFRIATLSHRYKLGILVNCAEEQAIILGDRCGAFVHPIYIDFAQFYGCRTYRLISSDRSLIELEKELETKLEKELGEKLGTALSEVDPRDVFNCAQLYLIATSLIEDSPQAFLPSPDSEPQTWTPLEPSEEVQQRFGLIAHIVNCRSLLRIHMLEKATKTVSTGVLNDLPDSVAEAVLNFLEGPPDGTLSSLDDFFIVEYLEENKTKIASNPLTIGATTMLLAFRGRSLTAPEHKKAKSSSEWCESAERLVQTLSMHLERINETLQRCADLNDLEGCTSIKSSKVISLVALAEIYHHLSRSVDDESRRAEAQVHFLTAMGDVVTVVVDLREGNHLQKVHTYTEFSLCLAISMWAEPMVVRHLMGPSEKRKFAHRCDPRGCLCAHIPLLTEAYKILSDPGIKDHPGKF